MKLHRLIAKLVIFCILGCGVFAAQERKAPSGRAPVPRSGPSIPRGNTPIQPQSPRIPRVAPSPRTVPRSTIPRAPRGSEREPGNRGVPGVRPLPRGGLRPYLPRVPKVNPIPHVPRLPDYSRRKGHAGIPDYERIPGYGRGGPGSHYGRHYPGLRMHNPWPWLHSYRWFIFGYPTILPFGSNYIFCGVPVTYVVYDLTILVEFAGGEQMVLVPLGSDQSWNILNNIQDAILTGRSICLEVGI